MIYDKILNALKDLSNIIFVESVEHYSQPNISSTKLPKYDKFFASKIYPKKVLKLIINDEVFIIINGYVTFRRNIKMSKSVSKKRLFLFFNKNVVTYTSDETQIIEYLKQEKIIYKKDFDEKRNVAFYYFWKVAHLIISQTGIEEIEHQQLRKIKHAITHYNVERKKITIKSKENDIIRKANDLLNNETSDL